MTATLKKLWLPALLAMLALGFWHSVDFTVIAAGVAMFLFGMLALEEGFRTFAGGMLDAILRRSTDRVWKSLLFGLVSTTLVQSSSLISILTISFLSAGLISLAGGIGIIFGANLGTTTGAWLIAGFGLKVSISAYALPLLVFGVVLVFQSSKTSKGLGYVLVGLSLLFLGIDYMKQGFEAFKANIDLASYAMSGLKGVLVFTAIGVFATVVMQSSHATLVLILTALATGQITYENGLALAIGSNIGTTITAIIGGISANVDGRRLAGAHLIFNTITGAIAIAFLPHFILAVNDISGRLGIAADDYTLKLALFHSLFNLAGIVVMLPLMKPLEWLLLQLMRPRVTLITRPKYLRDAVIDYPDAAIEAVRNENLRLYDITVGIIAHGISLRRKDLFSDDDIRAVVGRSRRIIQEDINEKYAQRVKQLYGAIVEFISRARRDADERQAEQLHAERMAGSYMVEAIKAVKHLQKNLNQYLVSRNEYIRTEYDGLRASIGQVLREIAALRDKRDDAVTVLSLDDAKLLVAESDIISNGALDRLIRERRIDATMATSLINDNGYAKDVCNNLINAAQIILAAKQPLQLAAEQRVILDDAEIEQIVQSSDES